MRSSRVSKLTVQIVLLIIAISFLVPLVYILASSFKPATEAFQVPQSFLPDNWTLDNYRAVLGEGRFGTYFWTSIVITVVGVSVTTLVASLAGYGFAKLPFRGQSTLLWLLLAVWTIPLVIFLVPMFLMENASGLLNTKLGLILPNVAIHLPFATLIMRASFLGIPREIEESAIMDGAGTFRQWTQIMLPMARNGLVLTIIMTTYTTWGEYTLAKTLAIDPNAMPLTVGLTLLKNETWALGIMAAVVVLAILPPIIVFSIFQKHIVAGLATGAVKG